MLHAPPSATGATQVPAVPPIGTLHTPPALHGVSPVVVQVWLTPA